MLAHRNNSTRIDMSLHSDTLSLFRANHCLILLYSSGADPGFQVRGGALKRIKPSGGRYEHFWGISCEKSRFYPQKIIFFPILGGARPPPESAPAPYICVLSGEGANTNCIVFGFTRQELKATIYSTPCELYCHAVVR